jgi:hypothetical protein
MRILTQYNLIGMSAYNLRFGASGGGTCELKIVEFQQIEKYIHNGTKF